MTTDTLTPAQEIAVEAVRHHWTTVATEDEGRTTEQQHGGDRFEVYRVLANEHGLGENGRCSLCGHLVVGTPEYAKAADGPGLVWASYKDTCFDGDAVWLVEFTYNDQGRRALYGVPAEGAPSLWAS